MALNQEALSGSFSLREFLDLYVAVTLHGVAERQQEALKIKEKNRHTYNIETQI